MVLMVRNLPFDCTERNIFSFLSPFGTVMNVRIVFRHSERKCSLGYALVHMSERGDAHRAIESLHDQIWNGRRIKVAWAIESSLGTDPSIECDENAINSVYVEFHSKKGHVINEIIIWDLFRIFGSVDDVCIKRLELTKGGIRRGYGFVHFQSTLEGRTACETAVSQFGSHVLLNMVFYKCSISKHFMTRKYDFIAPSRTSAHVDSFSTFSQSSIGDSCAEAPTDCGMAARYPTLDPIHLPVPLSMQEAPTIASGMHMYGIVPMLVPVLAPSAIILSGGLAYYTPVQMYYGGYDIAMHNNQREF